MKSATPGLGINGLVVVILTDITRDKACHIREAVIQKLEDIRKKRRNIDGRKYDEEWESREEAISDCKEVFKEVSGSDVIVIDTMFDTWI